MKKDLYVFLKDKGYTIEDCGVYTEESSDYPDYAKAVCLQVLQNAGSKGILVCGAGIGMSIAANKINGIRAALCQEPLSAKLARAHNDANVLCLGGRLIGFLMAHSIVGEFLHTTFDGGRHAHRLSLIQTLEKGNKHES